MTSSITDYAELPTAVLHEVFCRASFISKLKCEQVCKAWRSTLSCPAQLKGQLGASGTGMWGRHMSLTIEPSYTQGRTMKICGFPGDCGGVSFSHSDAPDLLRREEDFIAWLTPRAAGFQSVDVFHHRPYRDWLFPRLMMALGASTQHTPELTLHTGRLCNN